MECAICNEDYGENRLPKILTNCGHTFCELCIRKLPRIENNNMKTAKECPNCRQMWLVNGKLQTNFALISLIKDLNSIKCQPLIVTGRPHDVDWKIRLEYNELLTEHNRRVQEIAEMTEIHAMLFAKNDDLTAELINLREERDQREEEIDNVRRKSESTKKMKSENFILTSKLEQARSANKNLSQQLEKAQKCMKTTKDACESANKRFEEAQKKLDEAKRQCESERDRRKCAEKVVDENTFFFQQVFTDNKNLSHALHCAETNLLAMKWDSSKVRGENEKLAKELLMTRKAMDALRVENERAKADYFREYAKIENGIKMAKQAIESEKRQRKNAEAEVLKNILQLQIMASDNASLLHLLRETENKSAILENAHAFLVEENRGAGAIMEANEQLSNNLKQFKEHLKFIEKENEILKEQRKHEKATIALNDAETSKKILVYQEKLKCERDIAKQLKEESDQTLIFVQMLYLFLGFAFTIFASG